MFNRNLIFSKRFYLNNSSLIEGSIDLNFFRMKPIHRDSKIISLINMISREKLEAIRADLKIKALTQAKDQHFQEPQKHLRRVAFKNIDKCSIFILNDIMKNK